ncbi:MAG: hypothetical protein WC506_04880 [Candidatus Micrarchaeia archaeon]
MSVVGKIIETPKGNFKVQAAFREGGMRIAEAFSKFGPESIIRHGNVLYLYGDLGIRQKYGDLLSQVGPIAPSLMVARSCSPLGQLPKENGVYYTESSHRSGAVRFYFFTEEQARAKGVDLGMPAVAAIQEGYAIADISKDFCSYSIRTAGAQLHNMKIFPGRFENSERRKNDNDFLLPVGNLVISPNGSNARSLLYYKPGPAIVLDTAIGFAAEDKHIVVGDVTLKPGLFGILTEERMG